MRLVLHQDIPHDPTLREQWDNLVGEMEQPEVFYTYEWAQAVQLAYSASLHPLLVLAYKNGTLAGVASLATKDAGKEVCFLAATTADYCDFVSSPLDRAEFANAVLGELRRRKMTNVALANLPADSASPDAISAASLKLGYKLFSRPAYRCAQVLLHSPEQRELVSRSVSRRQAVRRHFATMEKVAPVKVDHCNSGGEIASLLRGFSQAHVARCLQAGRRSNLASAERQVFLQELADLLSEKGWITFSRLLVGDQAVAWNYGFQFLGSWFWYLPTFDLRWQQYSPGFCLLTKIVEEASHNENIAIVDLGLGDEAYKERVATANRATLYLTATQEWSHWACETIRYHAVTAIKALPRLENWLRLGRDSITRALEHVQTCGLAGLSRRLWSRTTELGLGPPEVFFFEWPEDQICPPENSANSELQIRELDLEILAVAAMRYSEDEETLAYLFRAARRLRTKSNRGFVLTDTEGVPVHFSWATQFDGFCMSELHHTLSAPSPRAILLFDCWTPISVRGRGYYGHAISRVAAQLCAAGRSPWIFSSAANAASLRGVKKAGFEPRFSLAQRRMWRDPEVVNFPTTAFSGPARSSSAA